MAVCNRTYGEGTYADCLYGGAQIIPGGCEDCSAPDPCPQQAPRTSGPSNRIVVVPAFGQDDC